MVLWVWLVINVYCSLTKDMTGKEDQYRGSAIRALCVITDVSICLSLSIHSFLLITLHYYYYFFLEYDGSSY